MKYLRRGVWYLASRLFLICMITGMAITVFYYAMNLSNMQIITKDGMAARAKVIMGIEQDAEVLKRYFQQACLDADEPLNTALNVQMANMTYPFALFKNGQHSHFVAPFNLCFHPGRNCKPFFHPVSTPADRTHCSQACSLLWSALFRFFLFHAKGILY